MHCGNEPDMPDCSAIGTVFVSRPRKVGERANDGRPPDLLGAECAIARASGGKRTPTQDGMIAECERANAEPQRQRRHWHGAAATTLIGSLRRFVTGDPAAAALGRAVVRTYISCATAVDPPQINDLT